MSREEERNSGEERRVEMSRVIPPQGPMKSIYWVHTAGGPFRGSLPLGTGPRVFFFYRNCASTDSPTGLVAIDSSFETRDEATGPHEGRLSLQKGQGGCP